MTQKAKTPAKDFLKILALCFITYLITFATRPAHAQPQVILPTPAQATGMFWDPNESGWGCNSDAEENLDANKIVQGKLNLFISCFVYDAGGKPVWLAISASDIGNTGKYTGDAYRTTSFGFGQAFNPASVSRVKAGTVTFDFTKVFNKTITFNIKDPTNVVQFNGTPNSQGELIAVKAVTRFLRGGKQPPTVERAQEKIVPQGVQVIAPPPIDSSITLVTDTRFLQAVLDGKVKLMDTGDLIVNGPNPSIQNRPLVYAYFTQINASGVLKYYVKPLLAETLDGFGDDRIAASLTGSVVDRAMGAPTGLIVRSPSNTVNSCAIAKYDSLNRGFSGYEYNACPVWI